MRTINMQIARIAAVVLLTTGLGFAPPVRADVAAAPGAAAASFDCGPHAYTYFVFGGTMAQAAGVRCVWRVYDEGQRALVWYGEGRWGAKEYRHLGAANHEYVGTGYPGVTPGTDIYQYIGAAADFTGNGEDFGGTADAIHILGKGPEDGWPRKKLVLEWEWNEEWILASSLQIPASYTPLSSPTMCGPNFKQYAVSSLGDGPGSGLRCELTSASPALGTVWFGNGQWGGDTYSHIGLRSLLSPNKGRAVDLCGPTFGQYCSSTPKDGLMFMKLMGGIPGQTGAVEAYNVTGAWGESWVRQ